MSDAPTAARPRVAFVTTHPIQYQVPVFRHLHERDDLDLVVLYAMQPTAEQQGAGFGVAFEWDLPLLEGYDWVALKNVAAEPSVTQFSGCDTPGIGAVLDELAVDAVVVNGWVVKTCLQALWAAKRRRQPCIVRGEANDLRPRARWKRALQGALVRRYDACLTIGTANEAFYLRRGVSRERLFPARYCVENDRFEQAAAAADRDAIRNELGIGRDAVCYLFSGKLEPKKHPDELIAAFRDATSRMEAAAETDAAFEIPHLLLVGDGELRAECERLADGCDRIHFAGFVNQTRIPELYAAADCLVLPSDAGETWGLVVNEAMATGLPAIVSDEVGCSLDLIIAADPSGDGGETGWIVPCGEQAALADRLIECAQIGRLQAAGERAKRRIAHYTPAAAADGIAQAVLATLAR